MNNPLDLSKLRVYGPGISADVRTKQRTNFTIDSTQVGSNDVEVTIVDSNGDNLLAILEKTGKDGIVTVNFSPEKAETHQVKVFVEGIPTFDIKLNVTEAPIVPTKGIIDYFFEELNLFV